MDVFVFGCFYLLFCMILLMCPFGSKLKAFVGNTPCVCYCVSSGMSTLTFCFFLWMFASLCVERFGMVGTFNITVTCLVGIIEYLILAEVRLFSVQTLVKRHHFQNRARRRCAAEVYLTCQYLTAFDAGEVGKRKSLWCLRHLADRTH